MRLTSMQVVNYSYIRQNLASMLDHVAQKNERYVVTRKNGTAAILISLDDFNKYIDNDNKKEG